MKASVQNEFGGPDVLQIEDLPDPQPGPDDVVIAVQAVSVNRTLDLAVRGGTYLRRPPLPHVLGVDPSGVIVEVGSNVTNRSVGDRVVANPFVPTDDPNAHVSREVGRMHLLGVDIWGGYAELVCIPATNTRLIPEGVSFEQATVIARHGPTALNLIENCGRLAAGETVLVMGASGGIGSMAIQISKLMEANVIAAAGRDSSLEAVVELGADAAINYSKEDITEQVERFTDGKGVDVVCENVGDPKLWPQAFQSLAVGGRLVTAGAHAGGMVQVDLKRLYFRRLQIIGDGSEAPDGFERSLSWASKGKVKGLVDRVMHFDDAPEAHRAVAERSTVGKILLTPQSKSNHLSAELS